MLEQINNDWKQALRDKDTLKKETLSSLRAAIKNAEIEKRGSLEDNAIVSIINKEIAKRNDAADAFGRAGREESRQKELDEAKILSNYIPKQISDEELASIVDSVISEYNSPTLKDMGPIMKKSSEVVAGRADNKRVSLIIRDRIK